MNKYKKYNISKTSQFLNISNELLRHYERLGLIEPERGDNGYRFFSFHDIDKLQGIRRYRNMNFSLEDMDRLIYTADYDEVSRLYAQSLAETERKLAWYQELKLATEKIIRSWMNIEAKAGQCQLVMCDDILRVDLRHNDVLDETIVTEETASWIECLPVTFISPRFDREAILSGSKDVSFGYGVEYSAFERLGLNHIRGEQHILPCQCVTTIIYSVDQDFISAHSLRPVLDFCAENGLELAGDAWGVTLGNCSRDGKTYRYHQVYAPVR